MILEFNKDLSLLEVAANGRELAAVMGKDRDWQGRRTYTWSDSEYLKVAEFHSPFLVTDNYRISQFEPILRDTLFALYSSSKKIIRYDGTSIKFDTTKYAGVWSPSIDTLLFCRALGKTEVNAQGAIEIGCGSAFISKYLAEHTDFPYIHAVDINPNAGSCIYDNMRRHGIMFKNIDGLEAMKWQKFNLIFSNPPYILRPKSVDDNAYEGISLIIGLIDSAKEHLSENGKLLLNVSTLSGALPQEAIERNKLNYKVLDQMTVPLKVFNVLNNPAWMDYLGEKGLLKKESKHGYDYWHTIKILEITA